METVNLKLELETIKSQPTEQRIESIFNLIMSGNTSTFDESNSKFLSENFSLELKAIKLANRSISKPSEFSTKKVLDFYNELIETFGDVENFNKFRKQISYFI